MNKKKNDKKTRKKRKNEGFQEVMYIAKHLIVFNSQYYREIRQEIEDKNLSGVTELFKLILEERYFIRK